MAQLSSLPNHRSRGYPSESHVLRSCAAVLSTVPDVVYRTCCVCLHNVSKRKQAALLEVFKNNTLAAAWMLRDIEQRDPMERFAVYRKQNSTSYNTKEIATALGRAYLGTIRTRYALNANLFEGLCKTIAAMLSSWLQKKAEAQQGDSQRYQECASYIVPVGKHAGKVLGSLGRKTIYGYAFLRPTPEQYGETLRFLDTLIDRHPENAMFRSAAEAYILPFGADQGRTLGSMRPETLRRLRILVAREIERVDQFEDLRAYAKGYLRYSPPSFPSIASDGLTVDRQRALTFRHFASLDAFGALPDVSHTEEDDLWLAENEYDRFRYLQRDAYAATHRPVYVPLRWGRADAFSKSREMGVGYEAERERYVLMLYVLANSSRYKRQLQVRRTIIDVNNPTVVLKNGKRPSTGMLFEIECDASRKAMLDQARMEAMEWKAGTTTSGGCIRAATLHAHMGEDSQMWFEAQIVVGTKPQTIKLIEHIVGVHVDPKNGIFLSIHQLDGTCSTQFRLDAARIAQLLENKDPQRQVVLTADQRTTKERQHRLADALVALCVQYHAVLGIENIGYRWQTDGRPKVRFHELSESSRSVVELLNYKLPLENLLPVVDIRGIAPRRDCGICGARQDIPQQREGKFNCLECGHCESRYLNTAREVARRTLWILASKQSHR